MSRATNLRVGVTAVVLGTVCVVAVVGGAAYLGVWPRPRKTAPEPSPEDKTDTEFLKLRFEHSDDLVDELEGLKLYQTLSVRCNDGVVRPVKVALLDRKLGRAGIVVVSSVGKVGGNMGGRAYGPNSTAFVKLSWLRGHIVRGKE